MAISMENVMRRVRNYFQRGYTEGTFDITGNVLSPAPAAPWVAIRGSLYHDGVYRCTDGVLQDMPEGRMDERFTGVVWHLHPPDDFVSLVEDINAYDAKNPAGAYQSESFGDYSYTRPSGANGGVMSWETAYADALRPYKRMFSEVG